MSNGTGRISKPPEKRKQEIMDVAMQVFAKKGYEQSTMRDIAAEVGVVPGLCYRYFESKQELFHAAISQYVTDYCAPIIRIMKENQQSFDEVYDRAANLFTDRYDKEKYHSFFHKKENEDFNTLMSHAICAHMQPFLEKFLDTCNENGTLTIPDTVSFSKFILYGQIAIINDEYLSATEKAERIKEYIKKLCDRDE